jgi:hypothetical protein
MACEDLIELEKQGAEDSGNGTKASTTANENEDDPKNGKSGKCTS